MSLPRGTVQTIGNKRADPVLRSTEGGIPPGTEEARQAFERVKHAMRGKRAYVPRSFTVRR